MPVKPAHEPAESLLQEMSCEEIIGFVGHEKTFSGSFDPNIAQVMIASSLRLGNGDTAGGAISTQYQI